MKDYYSILFVFVLLFFVFLILNWVGSQWNIGFGRKIGETMTTNTKYIYIPSNSNPGNQFEFGLADLEDEAKSICDFIKVDGKLVVIDPSATDINGDYTKPKTDLEIHKLFTSATSSPDKIMDEYFKTKPFDYESLKDKPVKQFLSESKEMAEMDQLYNDILYFAADKSGADVPSSRKYSVQWMPYFINAVQENSNNQTALAELKKSFYSMVRPILQQKILFKIYEDNATRLRNIDGGSNDSILYVLNTSAELASPSNISTSEPDSAEKENPSFPKDRIRLFQITGLLLGLNQFIERISKNSQPLIKMNVPKFVAGFPLYLNKKNQVALPSATVFILKNPPNIAERQPLSTNTK